MDSTLKYAEHKLDEAIKQGETDVDISYWRGYRDCANVMERYHFRDSTKMMPKTWEPCDQCKSCESCYKLNSFHCFECKEMSEFVPDSSFCGKCGRPRTLGAWEEMEKRLRG